MNKRPGQSLPVIPRTIPCALPRVWANGAARLPARMVAGLSIVLGTGLVFGALPARAQSEAAKAGTVARSETVTLNFVNADLESVVRAVGQFLRKDILVDPRVKGTLTLAPEQPVNRDEAWRLLLAALRFQGFAVVDTGGFAKVVPEADAKFLGGPTEVASEGRAARGGDQLVTQIFRLNYESAVNVLPMLRPLVTANNPITANASNNTLVITDYAENLKRIGRIVAAVDAPAGSDPEVVPLKYALAVDLAGIVGRLLEPAAGAGADAGQRVTVLAEPRTNALLLRAVSSARLAFAKALIIKLDTPTTQPGNIHVVYLKNADATKLAQTLRAVMSGDTSQAAQSTSSLTSVSSGTGTNGTGATGSTGTTSTQGSTTGSGAGSLTTLGSNTASPFNTAGSGSGGGFIQADAATNALIITAPEPLYRNVRSIIESLDIRRAQVFVESLIVEVTADTAAEFGIQWQGLSGVNSTNTSVIGGTNFGTNSAGANIISASQNLSTLGNGLNIGIMKGTVTIPGIGTITNLGFLARALESRTNANILSTPNLLTMDNEAAQIVIGQNVPFITGQYAQTGTTTSVTPFQTVERRDVGLTLRVKPQISDGDTVKMQIYQEVSSVQTQTVDGGIVTNKRAIESNVQVDNGQIIVIGGLVQDSVTNGVDKVPLAGDVPIFGNLFKSESRKRTKTNLMVFLRPYVIRGDDAGILANSKYDAMRRETQAIEPARSAVLPDMPMPQLPPLPLAPPTRTVN